MIAFNRSIYTNANNHTRLNLRVLEKLTLKLARYIDSLAEVLEGIVRRLPSTEALIGLFYHNFK